MASSARAVTAALAFALATCVPGAAAQREQSGQFALYRGKPEIRSDVRLIGGNILQIVQYPLRGDTAITRYANVEHQPLHLVLVRDDFASFSHVHPNAVGNGTFHVRVALDSGHRYYAFVGSHPIGYDWQVFRVTLKAGMPPHNMATSFEAPTTQSIGGPYRVTLSKARLTAGKSTAIVVRVTTPAGKTVYTHPFRGAQAHTVFINVQTLQYVHTDAPRNPQRIELQVPPLTRGVYRMWLEFNDGKAIYAAPFTLAAL